MKIGDKVRIKSWNQLRADAVNYSYGDLCFEDGMDFIDLMEELCGCVVTVEELTPTIFPEDSYIRITCIRGYIITTSMVEAL